MSETWPTARHHAAASPPVVGVLETSSAGRAPRSARRWRKRRTLERYRSVVTVQGVGTDAPQSSFSAIIGWLHPVTCTA